MFRCTLSESLVAPAALVESTWSSEAAPMRFGPMAIAALVPATCLINFRRVSGQLRIGRSSNSPAPDSNETSDSLAIVYGIVAAQANGGSNLLRPLKKLR